MTTKKQPTHTIRIGRVKAAIWKNQTEAHGTQFNVTICRLYKDGESWKDSQSFGRDDLPLVCKVLDQAHTWLFEQKKDSTKDKAE